MEGRTGTERRVRWRRVALALALTGAGLSGYLLVRLFRLMAGEGGGDICATLLGSSCDRVLLDSSPWLVGIPLPAVGLVYFLTVGYLITLSWLLEESFDDEGLLGALGLAAAGLIGSAVMTVWLLTGRQGICPLCLLIHLANLGLFLALGGAWGGGISGVSEAVRSAWRFLATEEAEDRRLAPWKLIGFLSALMVALIFYQWSFIQAQVRLQRQPDPDQLVARYLAAPEATVPVSDSDPALGPAEAPLELVVFSSFQCPGCRDFAFQGEEMVTALGGRLRLVFKDFPLSSLCNPAVGGDPQPRSCHAAWAAAAARRQGAFWPYHDRLFSSDLSASEDLLIVLARRLRLDLDRFQVDRASAEVHAEVVEDVELGRALRLPGTPSLFLNGRRLPPMAPAELRALLFALAGSEKVGPRTG